MQKKIKSIFAILLLVFACNSLPNSKGLINDITVVTSEIDSNSIVPIIEEFFNYTIYTPQEEKQYNLNWIDMSDLSKYKYNSNIFIISIGQTVDSTADFLYNRLISKYNNDVNLFSLQDIFAVNQLILAIKAYDPIELEEILIANNEWILNQFNQTIYSNVNNYLKQKGNNNVLEELLCNIFNINISIQKDYQLVREDSTNHFVWLGRGYPYRWLTFMDINSNILNSYKAWDVLISEFKKNLPEIIISEKFRSINQEVTLYNSSIKCLRGIYEHPISDTGGPFVSYLIEDNERNKVILASGFVNFPENRKYDLLQQLEVIIKSIEIIN